MTTASQFTVLPVKFNAECKSCHYLYCKPHTTRSADEQTPGDRTIFIAGVPPYCTEGALTRLFSPCGKVERIILTDEPTPKPTKEKESKFGSGKRIGGFKVAYVVFKNSKALQNVTALSSSNPFVLSTPDSVIETGMKKWCNEYVESRSVKKSELQDHIDKFMTNYDIKVQKEARIEKQNDGKADEDGWITVTKTGKFKGVPRTEAEEERTKAKEKKKRKEKELLNFYTFQIRESKRERIADLRKKFEEDKSKIAQLKSSRRFKPF